MDLKTCTKCKKQLQNTKLNFNIKEGKRLASYCKMCEREAVRHRHATNPESHQRQLNAQKEWRKNNPSPARKIKPSKSGHSYAWEWAQRNPERFKELRRLSEARVMASNPTARIKKRMRNAIRQSMLGRSKPEQLERLVGYTFDKLKVHLERQFIKSMSWENYGTFWHIDHIIPVASFLIKEWGDDEFRACWAITNLRPLEAVANQKKGSTRLHLL